MAVAHPVVRAVDPPRVGVVAARDLPTTVGAAVRLDLTVGVPALQGLRSVAAVAARGRPLLRLAAPSLRALLTVEAANLPVGACWVEVAPALPSPQAAVALAGTHPSPVAVGGCRRSRPRPPRLPSPPTNPLPRQREPHPDRNPPLRRHRPYHLLRRCRRGPAVHPLRTK